MLKIGKGGTLGYDKSEFTYGLELEFADIDTTAPLPRGLHWDYHDASIVNSDGVGNDPRKELVTYGSELNTDPSSTVEEQIKYVQLLLSYHPEAQINYSTNMHVHIGVPGLAQDLPALKQFQRAIHDWGPRLWEAIDPIPMECKQFDNLEDQELCRKRYNRRKRSHRTRVTERVIRGAEQATTIQEFKNAHPPLKNGGEPQWHIFTRPGINVLQVFDTESVEFRHFPQTLDLTEIRVSLLWAEKFCDWALNGKDFRQLLELTIREDRFPSFQPFDPDQDRVFQRTCLRWNTRKDVKNYLWDMQQVMEEEK